MEKSSDYLETQAVLLECADVPEGESWHPWFALALHEETMKQLKSPGIIGIQFLAMAMNRSRLNGKPYKDSVLDSVALANSSFYDGFGKGGGIKW